MINYFKAAERVLSERGNLEKALANLQLRLSRAIRKGAPGDISAIDPSRAYVSTSTTADALSECLEVMELTREIRATEETIQDIDRVLEQLTADDAALLRAWYIWREPKSQIMEDTGYSSLKTVYDMRNKAVAAFAILYYGASALSST